MSIIYGPTYTSLEQVRARMDAILSELRISREEFEERMAEYTLNRREAEYRDEFETLQWCEELFLDDLEEESRDGLA
ncbi:hypothetical protein [Actinotignum schaalii]|uniref:hypothetical protein n=1 Tax=Actinotignum schaalii TaxID=59505 RepID=UPI000479BF4F|nr:hypothetical protein [Actinotignum schaalii]AIE82913.1 hypothetical protein FB03_06250 [Actinotignum schaalii]WQN45051.1 hypothetical protein U4A90_08710 [Actinotignum schaalii]